MKVRLLLLSIVVLTMTGCIKEDLDGCPTGGSARLVFHYTIAGVDKLPDYVFGIDAIIFDEDGKFLMHEGLDVQSQAARTELLLTLDPGIYYFVCWGNVADHSVYSSFISGVTALTDCSIEISPGITAGDPIYYAPAKAAPPASRTLAPQYDIHKIEIMSDEHVVKDVEFVKAHRSITVYLKNAPGAPNAPKVRVNHLCKSYNFLFEPQAHIGDFTHITSSGQYAGETYDMAVFYAGMGQITSDMDVNVLHGADERILHTENIGEFLTANPSHDPDDIHMVIEFSELGVTVTVPSWNEKPVTPGAF